MIWAWKCSKSHRRKLVLFIASATPHYAKLSLYYCVLNCRNLEIEERSSRAVASVATLSYQPKARD
jgi:hypothetical protein